MKKIIFVLICLQAAAITATAQVQVLHLRTENRNNPVGLDAAHPRFSWQLAGPGRNIMQQAYELKVMQGTAEVWSTGKINSDQSVQVTYAGQPLQSGKKYSWQVRVWDNTGKQSAWSSPATWQTALLNSSDWKAQWITPGFTEDSIMRPSPLFRKQFAVGKKVQSAIAYITAHGMYEAQINGRRVGDAYFTPGWTSYNKRLQYQTYDVTSMLQQGNNVIGVTLGSGWYRGHLAWNDNKDIYGKDIALLMQLDITYTDGSSETIASDNSWKSSVGAIRYSEIYNGEIYDAREEKKGWSSAGYDDSKWSGVKLENFSKAHLLATVNEPVKKHETFIPVKIFTTPKGEKVIDFGQNLVGWVVVTVKGNAGDRITLSHAEVLDKEGNFYTDNLRLAKAQDIYTLKGGTEETFEPHFTWQGFRYVKVEGWNGPLTAANFKAVALYSDMEPTGSFSSSNTLVNQLQHNIQWGQKGNFLDVPTDCPQRDERLGWTGDAQVFSRTASFNMNVNNFFAKWTKDVAADQSAEGIVPMVVPNVLGTPVGSTGWGDVATVIPWNMYLAYGDKQLLADQYPSMKAWVDYMKGQSKNDLWNTGFHFGDWLFYSMDDDRDGRSAITDKYLIAQCFYAYSTQLLINAAKVLGNEQDATAYTDLLQRIKAAFVKEYVTGNGRLVSGTQTAYVLALNFDMLPEGQRASAAAKLAANVKEYNNHLTTGFLGTPYLCHVLSRFGYDKVAYKLLLQDTYPSWLYPVKMGATTIWERWDGIKPDSTFETPTMNSYNHYAYGAIGDWMYRVMVGMDTYEDGAGYKHIRIQPHPGGGFTHAEASLQTYYGKLASGWKKENGKITVDAEIPANTNATIYIPAQDASAVSESGKPLAAVKGIGIKGTGQGYVIVETGSGIYHFSVATAKDKNINIDLNEYTGKYKTAGGGFVQQVDVSLRDGRLYLQAGRMGSLLEPQTDVEDRFESSLSDVDFSRDGNKKVNKVKLEIFGMTVEGTR